MTQAQQHFQNVVGSVEQTESGPLKPGQLSDHELQIIQEIERRLEQAKTAGDDADAQGVERYLKRIEERHARVLLLDGGRGTGKTSILLTLVKRWHHRIANAERVADDIAYQYERRIDQPHAAEADLSLQAGEISRRAVIPRHIRVLDVLDFDPLPPGMPLIAGIMQTWRPLAEEYDLQLERQGKVATGESGGLMDQWYRLFHTAAAGWGTVSHSKGLLEQVLDRQEQVENWQRLGADWRSFVWQVLKSGRGLEGENDQLPEDAVFVIMIDDCDLQVERIRQLLPALRMLYHPRVFFIVAADRRHMIDMLRFDFYGQQNELGKHENANPAGLSELVHADKWAQELAQSSFEKVFPIANQWKLEKLSLLDFLAFPGRASDLPTRQSGSGGAGLERSEGKLDAEMFFESLNELSSQPVTQDIAARNQDDGVLLAGRRILDFAENAQHLLPGVMTYRSAQQLHRHVTRFSGPTRAAEILARLIAQENEDGQAVVRGPHEVQTSTSAAALGGVESAVRVELQTTGELAALYRPGPHVSGGTYNVVVSTRPDFVFLGGAKSGHSRMSIEPEHPFNFTKGLVAKTLEEAGFLVDASTLSWNTFVSHAWTEWQLNPRASVRWTLFEHPTPDRLFLQTKDWTEFTATLSRRNEPKYEWSLERYAYAWVFFQRKWAARSGHVGPQTEEKTVRPDQLTGAPDKWPWASLLDFSGIAEASDKARWQYEILPLLARPEIGFPPLVQREFLQFLGKSHPSPKDLRPSVIPDLKRQRQRLLTDAVIASRIQLGGLDLSIPPDTEIQGLMLKIDDIYLSSFARNYWTEIVA